MAGNKIINGTPVDAVTTNTALLGRQADDTATGIITFANTSAGSGATVDNIQGQVNSLNYFTGTPANYGPAPVPVPAWTTNESFSSTDNLFDRTNSLSDKFPVATGHAHDGTPGGGAPVVATSISGVTLLGRVVRGVDITGVIGGSTDVSVQFASSNASTNTTTQGVVVNAPYNKVVLRQATGPNTGDEFVDGSGNEVYARITNVGGLGGTWTLTYYVDIAGTETPYSFGSSVDVAFYYQQLINPIASPYVYSEFAYIPSENATEDVIDATPTQPGKVSITAQAFGGLKTFNNGIAYVEYADSTTTGTNASVPLGSYKWVQLTNASLSSVASIQSPASGEIRIITNLTGNSISIADDSGSPANLGITTGTGSSLTIQNTGTVIVAYDSLSFRWRVIGGSGGGSVVGWQEVPAGTVNGVNTTFGPLTYVPQTVESIEVYVDGVYQALAAWTYSAGNIVFNAGYIPVTGQSVEVFYLTAGVANLSPLPAGSLRTEFRTLTSGEATAKQLTLAFTPVNPGYVLVDVIGGTSQEYNVDYTIASNILSWNGYALDGVLSAGDRLRIHYQT